jgi:hypothetical protein
MVSSIPYRPLLLALGAAGVLGATVLVRLPSEANPGSGGTDGTSQPTLPRPQPMAAPAAAASSPAASLIRWPWRPRSTTCPVCLKTACS